MGRERDWKQECTIESEFKGANTPILRWRIQMKDLMKRLWKDESGQDLTEYALLLVLVALLAVATLKSLSTAINLVYSTAASDLAVTT